MRRTLILTGTAVAAAVLAAVALLAPWTEGPRANVAHASGIDEAARELDLIRPARPKQASDFSVSLLGGQTLDLKGQRGKPILINFWATWCAPCREEMPAMERLYLKHRERGFMLLAVYVDTDAALVKPFLEKYRLTFPVALDARMALANTYGVRALPASFLIDRNGYLAALALGPRAWDNRAANTLVEGLLAQ